MNFVDVAVPSPLRSAFTYRNNTGENLVGRRVLVEFGRRKLIGVVTADRDDYKGEYKIKDILQTLDYDPTFSKAQLLTIKKISDHYMHPIGMVLEAFLPTMLRKAKTQLDLSKYSSDTCDLDINEDNFHELTSDQKSCLEKIKNNDRESLLFGVTSSGKTEIYKHYIKLLLQEGKSALVLVPEIFITPQIHDDFKKNFNDSVYIHHSGLTELQRFKIWLAAQDDKPKIIIGTRSAIFLPIKNLGTIIFDEEHDQSYKQQDGFRYDARTLAKIIYDNDVKIIYSSATPSLNTLQSSKDDVIQRLSLKKRISKSKMPNIEVHPINKKNLVGGISHELMDEIKKNDEMGNQTLILLNRRGYAPVFLCNSCGWIAKSNCCDTSLVLHQEVRRLKCHRCESAWGIPDCCPSCGASDFSYKGVGTQQVEEAIKDILPKAEVIRIDRDSVAGKARREKSSLTIKDIEPKIFVGTQLLAKGHDFKKITLIIILNLDFGLFGADIHLQEQTAQLLIQVAGRAGRTGMDNKVYLQTRVADHPMFNLIKTGDYELVANEILNERKKLDLSPYIDVVYLKAEDANQARLRKFLVEAKKYLSKEHLEVYGPFEAPITKVGYKHRMFCIIQSSRKEIMLKTLDDFVSHSDKQKKEISNWVVDIDPINAS